MKPGATQLETRRREFEEELDALRSSLEERIGWSPRGRWVLPLVGVALGFSAAVFLAELRGGRRRRRHRR